MRGRRIMRECVREPSDSDVIVLGPPNLLAVSLFWLGLLCERSDSLVFDVQHNPLLDGIDRVLLLQYTWSNWGAQAIAFYFTIERADLLAQRWDRVHADLAVAS
jgi:hypothetical protein